MLTAAQLATTIVLICGVTTKTFDTPKVQACLNFFVNCAVTDDGKIENITVRACEREWDKKNASK